MRFVPALTVGLLVVPVFVGLLSAVLPGLGYFPLLGGTSLSLEPLRAIFAAPGIERSIFLAAFTGLASTSIALLLTFVLLACAWNTPVLGFARRLVAPLLSVPHAAAAVGLAFLIAPSGFLFRLLSPELTGFSRPPDLLIIQDPLGLAMIAGLVAKEMPFLMLMALAALPGLHGQRRQMVLSSMGYGRATGFFVAIAPPLYRLIRLPVFAVLVYASSVADVALILGPTTPAPLAVRILEWASDPDLSGRFQAAAGALVQIALTLSLLALWIAGERALGWLWRAIVLSGWRGTAGSGGSAVRAAALTVSLVPVVAVAIGLTLLVLWSFAGPWRFPDALPASFTLRSWMQLGSGAWELIGTTLWVAIVPTLIAAVLIIGCLEVEHATGRTGGSRALLVLYLPLLIPQVTFLFGLQFLAIVLRADGMIVSVMAVHLVFVLPYMYLSLADPYRRFDPRILQVAAGMGMGFWRRLFQVRMPMMLAPLLTALAIGIAVSIGQYLPTLLIGSGRVPTLTTEAVALSAGGNRRALGVAATLQAFLPFVAFWLALAVPAFVARNRRGLQVA
ncbi:MAG: ABC transporter permease [Devosiaceae bacterium]|nr:ABC transporter permease [Devosiaceae bacterium MH13]